MNQLWLGVGGLNLLGLPLGLQRINNLTIGRLQQLAAQVSTEEFLQQVIQGNDIDEESFAILLDNINLNHEVYNYLSGCSSDVDQIIELLISKEIYPPASSTPLREALRAHCSMATLKLLIDQGATPQAETYEHVGSSIEPFACMHYLFSLKIPYSIENLTSFLFKLLMFDPCLEALLDEMLESIGGNIPTEFLSYAINHKISEEKITKWLANGAQWDEVIALKLKKQKYDLAYAKIAVKADEMLNKLPLTPEALKQNPSTRSLGIALELNYEDEFVIELIQDGAILNDAFVHTIFAYERWGLKEWLLNSE